MVIIYNIRISCRNYNRIPYFNNINRLMILICVIDNHIWMKKLIYSSTEDISHDTLS